VKQFQVPIYREEGPRENLPSDTDVIVCPGVSGPYGITETIHVERVKLKARKSVDEYDVYKRYIFGEENYVWFRTTLTKLGRVPPNTYFLVKLDPRRTQRCARDDGHWHGILTSRPNTDAPDTLNCTFVCGGYYRKALQGEVMDGTPTCPDCLLEDEWLPFRVGEYERPEHLRKIQEKEAAERRFRQGLPTRFDRIDALDEVPPPPPEELVLDLEPDPEEPEGREAKLMARVRHQRRIEEAINQKRYK